MNVKIIGIGAVLSAIMLVAIFYIGLVPLEVGRVDVEPITRHQWQLDGMAVGNYDGTNRQPIELITNPVGGIEGKRNAFILGKTSYSESEFITAQAYCWNVATLWSFIGRGISDYGWYEVKYKDTNSAEWETIADETGNKKDWVNYANPGKQPWLERSLNFLGNENWKTLEKALSLSIIGNHPGAIRIEVHTEIRWDLFDSWHEVIISSDEAELLSSGGTVKRVDKEATYEEGESFDVRIETDYSGRTVGEQQYGYVVKIIDPDGNEVSQQDVTDNYDGTITIEILSGWYSPDWSNQFRISLQNQFRNIGEVSFAAVDVIGLVPEDCTISTNIPEDGKIQAGENVIVDFSAGEKAGAVPIISFRYCAFYGPSGLTNEPAAGSADWVQDWTYVTAEEVLPLFQARIQFRAPEKDGYVTILGWTNGEGNRLSERIIPYGFYVFTDVEPSDGQLDQGSLGEGEAYQGGYRGLTNWFEPSLEDKTDVIGIIIAIVIASIIGILAALYIPLPIQFKIGIAIILAIIVGTLIYYIYYLSNLGGGI